MSHYRKIKVNEKEYEYAVGKDGVKIKGLQENGNITKRKLLRLPDYMEQDEVRRLPVSPGMIADYINNNKPRKIKLKRATPTCSCGKPLSEKHWRCDPFDAEVYGEYRYAMWCDECYEERSWDI